ncbi:MAG: hypothetical protein IH587_04500 [Anaerolineae bacterium]|nr:hypothetical protein [Anaerolineae bacterium]
MVIGGGAVGCMGSKVAVSVGARVDTLRICVARAVGSGCRVSITLGVIGGRSADATDWHAALQLSMIMVAKRRSGLNVN